MDATGTRKTGYAEMSANVLIQLSANVLRFNTIVLQDHNVLFRNFMFSVWYSGQLDEVDLSVNCFPCALTDNLIKSSYRLTVFGLL